MEIEDVPDTINMVSDVMEEPRCSDKHGALLVESYLRTQLQSNLDYDAVGISIKESKLSWKVIV